MKVGTVWYRQNATRQKNAIGVLFVNTYLTMAGNHVHCIPSAGKAVAH